MFSGGRILLLKFRPDVDPSAVETSNANQDNRSERASRGVAAE
jgi:hypothetical protein